MIYIHKSSTNTWVRWQKVEWKQVSMLGIEYSTTTFHNDYLLIFQINPRDWNNCVVSCGHIYSSMKTLSVRTLLQSRVQLRLLETPLLTQLRFVSRNSKQYYDNFGCKSRSVCDGQRLFVVDEWRKYFVSTNIAQTRLELDRYTFPTAKAIATHNGIVSNGHKHYSLCNKRGSGSASIKYEINKIIHDTK